MKTIQVYSELATRVDNSIVPAFGAPQAAHVFKCLRAMLSEAVTRGDTMEVVQFLIRQHEIHKDSLE